MKNRTYSLFKLIVFILCIFSLPKTDASSTNQVVQELKESLLKAIKESNIEEIERFPSRISGWEIYEKLTSTQEILKAAAESQNYDIILAVFSSIFLSSLKSTESLPSELITDKTSKSYSLLSNVEKIQIALNEEAITVRFNNLSQAFKTIQEVLSNNTIDKEVLQDLCLNVSYSFVFKNGGSMQSIFNYFLDENVSSQGASQILGYFDTLLSSIGTHCLDRNCQMIKTINDTILEKVQKLEIKPHFHRSKGDMAKDERINYLKSIEKSLKKHFADVLSEKSLSKPADTSSSDQSLITTTEPEKSLTPENPEDKPSINPISSDAQKATPQPSPTTSFITNKNLGYAALTIVASIIFFNQKKLKAWLQKKFGVKQEFEEMATISKDRKDFQVE